MLTLIRYLVLVPASFIVDLSGLIVVPIALLFTSKQANHLPPLFWPWDNDTEGINGDAYWKQKYGDRVTSFYCRFLWLAIRNPGNNFGYYCGWLQTPDCTYRHWGDPKISNQPYRPGQLFVIGDNGKNRAFCLYVIWPSLPGRCLRIFLGWKIHDMCKDGTAAQLVCVVNPFMSRSE
ncbi:MAG: hypothetical protein K8F27_15065 [Sulfuricellaceae bacterium]|nr:hypothetical protein [Sulfuricellaceae bacterium]